MADQFLMVVTDNWTELQNANEFVQQNGESQLIDLQNTNQLGGIDALLGDFGVIPEGMTLSDFRMFREADNFRIWYILVPIE